MPGSSASCTPTYLTRASSGLERTARCVLQGTSRVGVTQSMGDDACFTNDALGAQCEGVFVAAEVTVASLDWFTETS